MTSRNGAYFKIKSRSLSTLMINRSLYYGLVSKTNEKKNYIGSVVYPEFCNFLVTKSWA